MMSIGRFRRRPIREEYDFFNSKPQQHRRGPTKETDLDRGEINEQETDENIDMVDLDDGGVYKGRSNNRERAREIADTRDTKIDLPVHYREVETVDVNN